ncbi:hypothetical protein C8K30_10530 [Promicromonospora sp. AC04]|uniref:hypothetical protein n=1 Tax=Promicromonospora sp. AC04 TaxID=2135723 RepID=UPI000D4212CA|nr:hypothetical protein [Promicromonospora sp. AC04]PUB26803.1 hypothetical protein C8K30_10530 [Promicromonospora sp. AC04]
MIFVDQPDIDANDLLDRAARLRTRGAQAQSIPEYLRETVSAEYPHYSASFRPRSDQPLLSLSEAESDTMRDAYERFQRRSAHRRDRARIHETVEPTGSKCPYCGISEATQFDHFAPKKGKCPFPQFAILPTNLVYCCGHCNQLKASASHISLAHLPFLHPYFDREMMAGVELVVDLDVVSGNPTLDVQIRFGTHVPPNIAAIVESHYERLGLLLRLRRACVGELGSSVYVARASRLSIDMALDRHSSIAAAKLKTYGPWYWDACLQAALGTDESFWRQVLTG